MDLIQSAKTRFFSINELVEYFIWFLDKPAIARLMQTNHHFNMICKPILFNEIKTGIRVDTNSINSNLTFDSKQWNQVPLKNMHYIRGLDIELVEIAYYVIRVFAYQDSLKDGSPSENSEQTSTTPRIERPLWLAPPRHIWGITPTPPLTLLTKLKVDCDYLFSSDSPARRSYKDPKATLTHICWIMVSNPHLQHLHLDLILLKDQRDLRLLTSAIFELKKLRHLFLDIYFWNFAEVSRDLASTFFFCCPPSLRSLHLEYAGKEYDRYDVFEREYRELRPNALLSWEKPAEECQLPDIPHRQESLLDLNRLWLRDLYDDKLSQKMLCLILQHCPNLKNILIPTLTDVKSTPALAHEISQLCPKLECLASRDYSGGIEVWELLWWLLRALPPQQVKVFSNVSDTSYIIQNLSDVESLFQRHSNSLCEISLLGCRDIDSKVIRTILVECSALRKFHGKRRVADDLNTLCIDLQDAILSPWGCSRLEELYLYVAIPEGSYCSRDSGFVPYYDRSYPIVLSDEEKQQFEVLETFYRQIGALTHLKYLDLRAIFYDPTGLRPVKNSIRANSFPGMLSLPDATIGKPGYLHLFEGLRDLRQLRGSVSTMTRETAVMFGKEEVAWIDKHWLALQTVHFISSDQVPEMLKKFQAKRWRDRKQRVTVSSNRHDSIY